MKKIFVLLAVLGLSSTAVAQHNDREGMWDFGVVVFDQSSESLSGLNGSSIDIDGTIGFGLSLAYNFNNHFSIGGELSWGSPDYDALLVPDNGIGIPERIRHELSMASYSFKGTYNLLDGPITPYLEGSFGWAYLDSNIADQPPITGCWWDPWWGYICDTFYSTYDKTQEFYTGAVGIRWDMDNGMTLKGSYGFQEMDTSNATEDVNLDIIRLELAWRF